MIRSFGVLKRVWSRICLTCKVEVRRIPGLNPMAILQEPKGLVRGVPACVGIVLLCRLAYLYWLIWLLDNLYCLSMIMN